MIHFKWAACWNLDEELLSSFNLGQSLWKLCSRYSSEVHPCLMKGDTHGRVGSKTLFLYFGFKSYTSGLCNPCWGWHRDSCSLASKMVVSQMLSNGNTWGLYAVVDFGIQCVFESQKIKQHSIHNHMRWNDVWYLPLSQQPQRLRGPTLGGSPSYSRGEVMWIVPRTQLPQTL